MMRRISQGVAVVAIALALPVLAMATSYKGKVKPSGSVSYDIKKVEGARVAKNIEYEAVPVSCSGQLPDTTSGKIKGAHKLNNDGNWSAVRREGESASPTLLARMRSTSTGRQNQRGEISISGSAVPRDSGGTGECGSEKLWKALEQ